jgi:thioesterase domain-containing protein
MDTQTLISTLRQKDVKLWVEADQLKCSAPKGALDAETRATLASRKDEIRTFLLQAETATRTPSSIVPIKPAGKRPPIFVVSGHGGDVFYFVSLSRLLDPEQPVIGVQPPGLDGSAPLQSVEELVRYQVNQIRRYRPHGPYLIAGHCAGGTIAFEVAQQLTSTGQDVPFLALIGSPFPTMFQPLPQLFLRIGGHAKGLLTGSLKDRRHYFMTKLNRRLETRAAAVDPQVVAARQRVENATVAAVRRYQPQHYRGQIDLFVTSDMWHQSHRWRDLADTTREHDLRRYGVDDLLLGSHVAVLADTLRDRLKLLTPGNA